MVVQLRQRGRRRGRRDQRAPAVLVRGALLSLHAAVDGGRLGVAGGVVAAVVGAEGMVAFEGAQPCTGVKVEDG